MDGNNGDAMRLNLGCGSNKLKDWINVDKEPACAPDQVVDLEALPWPWAADSVDEVLFRHSLEHLGASTELYLAIFKELYRVCRDGAKVTVIVPHPRHNHFLDDPTHVRPVTPGGLEMFSQAKNREWKTLGAANTPLGTYLGIDFDIGKVSMAPDPYWGRKLQRGEITKEQLNEAALMYNNVVGAVTVVMHAVKPAGKGAQSAAAKPA